MTALVNLQSPFCIYMLQIAEHQTWHFGYYELHMEHRTTHNPHCILDMLDVTTLPRLHLKLRLQTFSFTFLLAQIVYHKSTSSFYSPSQKFILYIYFAPVPSQHSLLLPHALAKDILSNVVFNSSVLTNRLPEVFKVVEYFCTCSKNKFCHQTSIS